MNDRRHADISDDQLTKEVARLARCEREATVTLIEYLGELYARRLHERAGYGSLFTYCVKVLGFSEAAAYDRMKAAKIGRRYPVVLDLLASGDINLTTVRLLSPCLTRENHRELLRAASRKSKRQVQELVAAYAPRPDVPSSVRKMPTAMPARHVADPESAYVAAVPAAVPSIPAASGMPPASPSAPRVASVPEAVLPLSPGRYRFTFTAGPSAREKFEFVQAMLRHAIPSGDAAEVFERALDALAEDLVREKFALTAHPRPNRTPSADPGYVTAEVKRVVYLRDRGRCAYVGVGGHRCDERAFLEFHHVIPRAAGGAGTAENIQLRCRAHNGYEVELFFGPAKRYRADEPGGAGDGDEPSDAGDASDASNAGDRVGDDTLSFRNENRQKSGGSDSPDVSQGMLTLM